MTAALEAPKQLQACPTDALLQKQHDLVIIESDLTMRDSLW